MIDSFVERSGEFEFIAQNKWTEYLLFKFIFSPAVQLEQLFFNRPVQGWARYRTPIKGLYLGGASLHPGGLVILGPGYLAANAVADDTTGGGNDVTAMQATSFGLASYLKDRVHRAGKTVRTRP